MATGADMQQANAVQRQSARDQSAQGLTVQGLAGGWGPTTIVQGVDLAVGSGESVAIVGRNGMGKTTLLELIIGRAQRHAGQVRLGARDLSTAAVHVRARAGLGHVPQQREVFPSLTVAEHLAVAMRPGRWTSERIYALFPSLAARRTSLAGILSGGEQQMLAIARALMGNPAVLLMDEPTEGLAPVVIDQLVHALSLLVAERELALVLVEQRIDIAVQLCARCLVLEHGHITREAASDSLRDESGHAALLGFE